MKALHLHTRQPESMPIYAYKCGACGHARDVLQKMSDPLLTVCPVCGADAFSKQLTTAGFQLKGSGWYATDFKGAGAPASEAGSEASTGSGTAKDGVASTPSADAGKASPVAAAAPAPAPAAATSNPTTKAD